MDISPPAAIIYSMPQTGPKSAGGKAVSSRNAVKHGLYSHAPVIPGLESPDDWQRHLDGIVASLQPQGHLETILANRIASLFWRLDRAARYETEITAVHLAGIPRDLSLAARYGKALGTPIEETITPERVDQWVSGRMLPEDDHLDKLMRYEAHLHRQLLQTLHELEAIQARRHGERSPLARLDVSGPPGA